MRRLARSVRFAAISILGLGLLLSGGAAKAHDHDHDRDDHEHEHQHCRRVSGTFEDQFMSGNACPDSPIMLCTTGELEGDLKGTYSFAFDTISSVGAPGDPDAPTTFSFTGMSHVVTDHGELFSHDDGAIEENATGLSPFFNHIHFYKGTGRYEDVHGELTAIGQVDFATGAGHGTYFGEICTGEDDDS